MDDYPYEYLQDVIARAQHSTDTAYRPEQNPGWMTLSIHAADMSTLLDVARRHARSLGPAPYVPTAAERRGFQDYLNERDDDGQP